MDSANAPHGVSVHAGFPNPGTDASLQALNLNSLLIQNGASTYCMRVSNKDWEAMGIFRDDVVLIDRALNPRTNDLVVGWYESNFVLTPYHQLPKQATFFGVVTTTIHQFRKEKL